MLIKYANELSQRLEFPGLAEMKLKHKVESTDAEMTYAGPKIDKAEWHKVLSFFRWTFKEAHSESQVRGFIDPVDNKLVFWAFPQEAGTGMTTREIPGEDFNKQREALPNSKDLIYFATVHHHCSATAFQSGGDSANEERPGGGAHENGQDGLHITVGRMDEAKHDLDVRFYLQKAKIVPNMAMFWDIGAEIKALIPESMHNSIALFQMCQKVEVDFPQEWKDNYRHPAPTTSGRTIYRYDGGMGYGCVTAGGYMQRTLLERIQESAWDIVEDLMRTTTIEVDPFRQVIAFLRESAVVDEILDVAMKERYDGMDLRTLFKEMDQALDDYEDLSVEEAISSGTTKENGVDTGVKSRKNRKKRKREAAQAAESPQAKAEAAKGSQPAVTGEPKHGDMNEAKSAHWDSDLRQWVQFDSDGGYGA